MKALVVSFLLSAFMIAQSAVQIFVNQVGFERLGPKSAIVSLGTGQLVPSTFEIVGPDGAASYRGKLSGPVQIFDWFNDRTFCIADFSRFTSKGSFILRVGAVWSPKFQIGDDELATKTVGSIISYYHHQRANTPEEIAADSKVLLYGSDTRVDLHGGWCDASGDVSKYFSHLAYANFMSPQQIPLVVWSMASARDKISERLEQWNLKDGLEDEALWGADYIMRSLAPDDTFYMVVFSYFSKDPNARRVVGLYADSVTTNEYQCAFRSGGGMAIAALARASQWSRHGEFTSNQYLNGAKRAFAHLLTHNADYLHDKKENITDDYCALLAATELWIATDEKLYGDEARHRAANLERRLTPQGYFISDDGTRPFWHASDAGLPVVALVRYLDKERDRKFRAAAKATIKGALDYNLRVTGEAPNPFGYARQTYRVNGEIKDGFFIPHENETGWWWQGEDARLASLATAAIEGGRLVEPGRGAYGVSGRLAKYATEQLSWILGANPYGMCFLYGFGERNVPHMHSKFGHGSEKGGISNGITGKEGPGNGSGIDFKEEDNGNEWRWTEQWLPHSAWFLQAVSAMASRSR
jgi:Glycosyl hydrolase family 9/Cellulase N-terminal ig-like domain